MMIQPITIKAAIVNISAFLFLFTISSGCQKNQDQNAGNTADSIRNTQTASTTNNYVTEYPVYKTESEKILAANRDTIASFRERLRNVNAKLRAALDSTEQALEKENLVLQSKIESFKAEGQDKWIQFKAQFDQSMDSIKTNLRDLGNRVEHIKVED